MEIRNSRKRGLSHDPHVPDAIEHLKKKQANVDPGEESQQPALDPATAVVKLHDPNNCTIRVTELLHKSDTEDDSPENGDTDAGDEKPIITDFLVDRESIAAASPFFKTLQTSKDFKDTGKNVVEIHDIEAWNLSVILCIAAGFFRGSGTDQVMKRLVRSTYLAPPILAAQDLEYEDLLPVIEKADEFLLEKKAVSDWYETWEPDWEWKVPGQLALGIAFHLDDYEHFHQIAGMLITGCPPTKTLSREYENEDTYPTVPADYMDLLETTRAELVDKFCEYLADIADLVPEHERKNCSELFDFLQIDISGKLIDKDAVIGSWAGMPEKVRDLLNNCPVPLPTRIRDELLHVVSQCETATEDAFSMPCLDCFNTSLRYENQSLEAWRSWAQASMTENCRAAHMEKNFRSAFVGTVAEADAILQLRVKLHDMSMDEEYEAVLDDEDWYPQALDGLWDFWLAN